MKQLSVYMSEDGRKEAKVFYKNEKEFVVVAKSDTGSYYNTTFTTLRIAEDFAEDWVIKDE